MYDYKFRQSDLSLQKPKRKLRKTLLAAAGLGIAAAVVYGIVQLNSPWQEQSQTPETSSDIIPLALPPHKGPDEDTQPTKPDQSRPAEVPTNRAFTDAMKLLQGRGGNGTLATTMDDVSLKEEGLASDENIQAYKGAVETNPNGTWIEYEVRPGDSLTKIFRDNDLSPRLLQSILRSGKEATHLKTLRPKDKLRIHLNKEEQFAELRLQLDALSSVRFSATEAGITSTKVQKETEAMATAVSGVIDHTLFGSAKKAGLPDAITMKMAKIFGWDIDFALEIRRGDRFTVIYEELWADGKQVGSGNVIAAKFTNQGHTHRALRYRNSSGKTDYYSPVGMPLRKTFFRSPVKFTRISSGFTNRRWHPVLKRTRAHKGVDYAAPTGTPIVATGDATVEYSGWKSGYGRTVYLRHGSKYRTVYGHMSRITPGLKPGKHISQGQIIGYVGQSGLATGPHLHYEFHVDGVHRNPLAVNAPIADPLPTKEMKRFQMSVRPLLASLEQTSNDLLVADAR